MKILVKAMKLIISIHAPREGSDACDHEEGPAIHISIHAPREGSDVDRVGWTVWVFQISIHAPREGSDALTMNGTNKKGISIHAPREGSDCGKSADRFRTVYFNPRSP